MSSCRSEQTKLLAKLNSWKKTVCDMLLKLHLFKGENDLEIHGSSIMVADNGKGYIRSNGIVDFYKNNSHCYAVKLVDNSIITLYLLTDKKGKPTRFSYAFCSCPFLIDLLIEEEENLPNNPPVRFSGPGKESLSKEELKEFYLNEDLKYYFKELCELEDKMVSTLIDLSKNPIYIRCDYDSENDSLYHPKHHLTLNFISESRFCVDSNFTFLDFVIFIMDAIYGVKQDKPYQFIHLSKTKKSTCV